MVDRTDRHFRVVMRQVTRTTLLYTEMISVAAALGPRWERVLAFDPIERPLALQLGGDDPGRLAEAARRAEDLGYDEVNLNCGCPSARVQSGSFGAVLMKNPLRVAACVKAMRAATGLPVTVKHRLGVDSLDHYEHVVDFVRRVARAGADRFIVHARKAWLRGLSPKQNRTVPPLRPDWVHRLKAEHPHLCIELNGGITSLSDASSYLDAGLDGVMLGRAAYDDPMVFAGADAWIRAWSGGHDWPRVKHVGDTERIEVLRSLLPHIRRWLELGGRLSSITRHMLGVAHGVAGARSFRRQLVEGARAPGAGVSLVELAIDQLEATALDASRSPGSTTPIAQAV